jgi:hypothetical protein
MRVVITMAAKADLIAIGDFIKPNNPERALTLPSPKGTGILGSSSQLV